MINNWKKRLLVSAIAGGVSGLALQALGQEGGFLQGWFAYTLLLGLAVFLLLSVWQRAESGRILAWMIGLAFFLRLGGGIALSLALPAFGYDNPQQEAGYPFNDSFERDQAAWDLAKSNAPLLTAFRDEFATDQYGGLLSLSAAVYRFLSPDAHRPWLILVLAAFVYALGVAFFWSGLAERRDVGLANIAGWILVLYPEGIFFSSSQMREPFLIGGLAVACWGVFCWQRSRRRAALVLTLAILFMALISWRVTMVAFIALAVWFWLENYTRSNAWLQRAPRWIIPLVAFLGIAIAFTSLTWLRTSMWWDFMLTERNSERLVIEIERIGVQWRPLVIIAFGMTQIILPAAIVQPAIALWRGIAIFRSAGWYLLAPMLIYSVFVLRKARSNRERRVLIWLFIASLAWIVLSSARAGGDLWDNPRYRTIFLPLMAVLAAWAWRYRGEWLYRLLIIEGIFLVFFTEWYLARYSFGTWLRMPFWHIILWNAVIGALVLLDGLAIKAWKRWLKLPLNLLRLRLFWGIALALFFEWYVSHHYYTLWMKTTPYLILRGVMLLMGLAAVGFALLDIYRENRSTAALEDRR